MMKTTGEYLSYDDNDFSSSESEEFYPQNDDSPPPPSPPIAQPKHFCLICNKQFGSGKAYGGHVRIHSTEYCNNKGKFKKVKKIKKKKKAKRGLVDKEKEKERDLIRADVEGKIRCCLCGKAFETMPSLFGHMRRHPDRTWKGVRPPPTPDNYKLSFLDEEGNDLMTRSVMLSGVPEDVQEAACNLMMIKYAELGEEEAIALSNLKKKYEVSLIVDVKMETEVEVNNPPDDKAKRSLGFDLNEPYHDEYSYWN